MNTHSITSNNKISSQFNVNEENVGHGLMIEDGYYKNKLASLTNLPTEILNIICNYIAYPCFYEEAIKQLRPISFANKSLHNNIKYFIDHAPVMKKKITEEQIKSQLINSMVEFQMIETREFGTDSLKEDKIREAIKKSLLNEMQCMNLLIQPYGPGKCENTLIALDEIARKKDIRILQLQIHRLYAEAEYRENFINDLFNKIKLITSNNREVSRIILSCQRFDMRSCITSLGEALANNFFERLIFSENQIGEMGAEGLAPYLKTMTVNYLIIGNNQIGNAGLEHIAKALPKGLTYLLLDRNNNITKEGVDNFFKILSGYAKNYPEYDLTLEGVNLSGNGLSENQFNCPEIKNRKGKIIKFLF